MTNLGLEIDAPDAPSYCLSYHVPGEDRPTTSERIRSSLGNFSLFIAVVVPRLFCVAFCCFLFFSGRIRASGKNVALLGRERGNDGGHFSSYHDRSAIRFFSLSQQMAVWIHDTALHSSDLGMLILLLIYETIISSFIFLQCGKIIESKLLEVHGLICSIFLLPHLLAVENYLW